MKTSFKKLIYFILLLGLLFACKKQVAGPKGENGLPGKNGNVNQTNIASFLLLSQDWITNNVKKDWNANLFSALITNEIIQKGEVEVYIKINDEWMPLPYTRNDFHFQYKLSVGLIALNYFKSHGVANPPEALNFRVLIVSSK